MSVVPGPASQGAVFKLVFASPALQCISHAHTEKIILFACFLFKFFASDQSKINTAYFRFVSLPKIFCFASLRFLKRFSRCFTSKRNEINIFFASFHFTRYRFEKLKDHLKIFLRFFTDCPRNSLYPFSHWSFHFFFVLFSLNFIIVSLQMQKLTKNTFFA